ncbi:MAG: AsmA-like C-terminal region-containing protein, partial [Bacteroidales bacterium]|nr:AsmA-like C-terminal region-containing protein [Bacteroidales bacterium]
SLTAEGKYLVVNGALINFDPVKQLSTFIELSELENISFEQLENDFFIRNNFLYIPQMDVKSSAVDLFVNGKHSFDNDYEYHVKMLLSEILSKKRKKSKSNISEFGVIEDDGLGRTSLLLKIEGKGETVKVGYDIKAASSEVKNNFKSERQTLKTILNQEYGWFKSDTTVKQKPAEKKSRFRITWEKTDTVKTTPDPPVVKKESVL